MHISDAPLLESVRKYFGNIGNIYTSTVRNTVEFRVSTIKDIVNVIIPHFSKYPLITQKASDYLLFKQIVLHIADKKHLTSEGLQAIVNLRSHLNWGLTDSLKKAFPFTIAVVKPSIDNKIDDKVSPEWLAGFTTGEACFSLTVQKSATKSGVSVSPRLSIGQDVRDIKLMGSLVEYLGCGYVVEYKRGICEYIVTRSSDIVEKIVPFYDKYLIRGSKSLDYLDFKEAVEIIKNKGHLDSNGKGLTRVLEIKGSGTSAVPVEPITAKFWGTPKAYSTKLDMQSYLAAKLIASSLWIFNSYKVISCKIDERKMDNRRSNLTERVGKE